VSATGGSAEVRTARRSGEEYLLERGLFRRKSTGVVVQPAYLEFAFPYYWHYDVLRALDYFRRSGADPDPRMAEAVAVVQSKRQPDGRWLLDRIHPGRVYFDSEGGAGTPSRWNTLCALRVLKWWDESPDDRTIEGKRSPRQSGHDQHDVADDRGVEPGLALVQAELRQVTMNFDATRSTYAWPRTSKNSRSCVQPPYTSSPQMKSKPVRSAWQLAQSLSFGCPRSHMPRLDGQP
jgi:hypothetical protein